MLYTCRNVLSLALQSNWCLRSDCIICTLNLEMNKVLRLLESCNILIHFMVCLSRWKMQLMRICATTLRSLLQIFTIVQALSRWIFVAIWLLLICASCLGFCFFGWAWSRVWHYLMLEIRGTLYLRILSCWRAFCHRRNSCNWTLDPILQWNLHSLIERIYDVCCCIIHKLRSSKLLSLRSHSL